jgi:hypothetical protein
VKRKPLPPPTALQTERVASIRAFWAEGKPAKFFKDYALQDLIDAGIPSDDLAKAGIIKRTGSDADLYAPVTLRQCAKIMSEHYGETVDPMRLTRAFRDKKAPGKRPNGLIVPAMLMAWWNVNEKSAVGEGALFEQSRKAELERKIDEARKARMEADAIERANSDKWMLVEYHNASMQRAGGVVWAKFTAIVEKDLLAGLDSKLKQCGASPELHTDVMNDAHKRHLAAVDGLQKEMEKLV